MFNSFNRLYHPSQYFLYSLIAFIAGIALASWYEIDWRKFELALFALMLLFLLSTIFWWRSTTFRLIGLLGLFLFLALWRFSLSTPLIGENSIDYYQGQTAQIFAEIINVDQRIDKQIITVSTKSLSIEKKSWDENTSKRERTVSGKVLLYAGRYPEFRVGDMISLKGLIKKAKPIEDFRYDRFLAKDDIYSLIYSDPQGCRPKNIYYL